VFVIGIESARFSETLPQHAAWQQGMLETCSKTGLSALGSDSID
jgi:hypothetical protein